MKNKLGRMAANFAAIAISTTAIIAWPQAISFATGSVLTATNFRSVAAGDLLVMGPVEQVDTKTSQVRVLGQLVLAPTTQRSIVSEALVGKVVAVYGVISADGSLKISGITELSSVDYVAGATELYVKGVVSAVNHANTTVRIGSLWVDYSGALHTLNADDIAAGKVIALSGLEFAKAGNVYADNGLVSASKPAGQAGSDSIGQAGSDLIGQAGSDKSIASKPAGQAGSDSIGQAGSDLIGQAGSDKSIASKPAGQAGSD